MADIDTLPAAILKVRAVEEKEPTASEVAAYGKELHFMSGDEPTALAEMLLDERCVYELLCACWQRLPETQVDDVIAQAIAEYADGLHADYGPEDESPEAEAEADTEPQEKGTTRPDDIARLRAAFLKDAQSYGSR
jgi:hypothetical protein